MDFIPRYAQPFTLPEAVKLDVSVITEEITRLQNSLQHLKQTQTTLQEYINIESSENADPEITKALEENTIVIGSQEERILILKIALSQKGVHYGDHYDLKSGTPSSTLQPTSHTLSQAAPRPSTGAELDPPDSDDSGIHL